MEPSGRQVSHGGTLEICCSGKISLNLTECEKLPVFALFCVTPQRNLSARRSDNIVYCIIVCEETKNVVRTFLGGRGQGGPPHPALGNRFCLFIPALNNG